MDLKIRLLILRWGDLVNLLEDIKSKKTSIAVVGLGYVGLPLAFEFARKVNVIGFDINKKKVEGYKNGIDVTGEIGEELKNTDIFFTNNEGDLKDQSLLLFLYLPYKQRQNT